MRWIPFMAIIGLSLVSALIIFGNYRNSKHFSLLVLAWLYLTGLGVILFTPVSFDGTSVYLMEPGIGHVNKTRLYMHGLGFMENIVLTIPLGMLLKKFVSQLPLLLLTFIGLIFSSGIEINQYYLSQNLFINRSSDINDIIANTAGVIIGGLVIIIYDQFKQNSNRN